MASAFSATRWVLLGSFGFRIVAYLGQWLILRLVSKELFGAYGSLVDIHLMMLPLLPLGMDALLVREKARVRRYTVALSQALALVGGVLMAAVAAALLLPGPGEASLAARMVDEGATWHAVLLMIPVFAVMATKLSIRSLLSARLDFRRISTGEFGNGLITYFAGALAVWLVPSAWSLMVAYLAGEIFECVWMYRRERFRPLAVLAPRRWSIMGRLLRRHWWFSLTNTADLTLNNIASLLPGPLILALLSASAAADFRVSRLLIQLPVLLLVGSIWRVAYPTLTGVTDAVLHDRCLRIIGTTAAFLAPLVIWLVAYADTTAWILGGEKYASAAVLVKWMGVYMVMTAIYSPISSLDMVRDRPEVGLYWNITHTIARVSVIWWFSRHGIVATIAAMSITSGILWLVWAWMLGRLLGCGMGRYFLRVWRFAPLWAAVGLGFVTCIRVAPSPLLAMALSVVPGGLYLAAIWRWFPEESGMIRRLLKPGT